MEEEAEEKGEVRKEEEAALAMEAAEPPPEEEDDAVEVLSMAKASASLYPPCSVEMNVTASPSCSW